MVYNKPVSVSGTPRVSFVLDSANDTLPSDSYAYYDPSFDIGRYGQGRRTCTPYEFFLVYALKTLSNWTKGEEREIELTRRTIFVLLKLN